MGFGSKFINKFNFLLAIGFGFQSPPQMGPAREDCAAVLEIERRILPRTESPGNRYEADLLTWSPVQIYMQLRAKFDAQRYLEPTRPYHFSVEEWFRPLAYRLLTETSLLNFKKPSWVSKAKFIEINRFHDDVIEAGKRLVEQKIPYEDFILWTRAYTQLMSIKVSLTNQGRLHHIDYSKKEIENFRKNLAQQTLNDVMEMDVYRAEFPIFLFPTDQRLSEMDFLRTRGIPVYYLGITNRILRADNLNFSPFDYWIHDLKDHAKMFYEADRLMFSASSYQWAGYAGLRSANGKWIYFLNRLDSLREDNRRSDFVNYLFRRFHELGWSIDRVPEVLTEAKTQGLLPPELKDFTGYNLIMPE